MSRIRHCKCPHFPESLDQLIDTLGLQGTLTEAQVSRMGIALLRVWDRAPASTHHHDRSLSYVTAPDPASGHQYWTGPHPASGSLPRVQVQGRRMNIVDFLWLRAGNLGNIPLRRTCHDPQCISPHHHAHAQDASAHAALLKSAALLTFDQRNPKIDFQPRRWVTTNYGEQCRAGHPLQVYGDLKQRKTYCGECYKREMARRAERKGIEQREQWALAGGMGNAPAEPSEPTLAEQVDALLREDDHVG